MNAGIDPNDACLYYYDGDYPSEHHGRYPENFDDTVTFQGLRHDVARYLELAARTGGPIVELCCGTGRVAVPLAAAGHDIHGVDLSPQLLATFRDNLTRQPADVAARVTLHEQDVTEMALPRRDFKLAVIAFNSLLCIPDFELQRRALKAAYAHLAPGGILAVDCVNPLRLKPDGDPTPRPFFTRRNPHNGNRYTRFAMVTPVDAENRQHLHGWYDEVDAQGVVTRRNYSVQWRPIYRHELQLMLESAGFAITRLDGGHQHEPLTAQSSRFFVEASKR